MTLQASPTTRLPGGLFGCGTVMARLAALVAGLSVIGLALMAGIQGARARDQDATQVYLVRGFMGIFSTGLDDLEASLDARGVKAETYGHLSGPAIRDDIVRARKTRPDLPVVLVGHSFGGNAVLQVAALLAQDGIRVALVITVDPTRDGPISSNVGRYINYYLSANAIGSELDADGKGARVVNIDIRDRADIAGLATGHWTMTVNEKIKAEILRAVLQVAQRTSGKTRPQFRTPPRDTGPGSVGALGR